MTDRTLTGARATLRWLATEYMKSLTAARNTYSDYLADLNRGRADAYKQAGDQLARQARLERPHWEMLASRAAGQPHGCGRCLYCGGIANFDVGCTYLDTAYGPIAEAVTR